MISKGQAGIDCTDCGYSEVVNTERMRDALEDKLSYHHGDPVCPRCGTLLTFEDYVSTN